MTGDKPAVIAWSSAWNVANGQAIVTRRVIEGQCHVEWIPAVYSAPRFRSAPAALRAGLIVWRELGAGRARTVYVVCSRSGWGFLRDLPALLPALFGRRVIVHAHGSDIVELLRNGPASPIARFLYSRCELIVPSLHLLPLLADIPLRALHVCENFLLHPPPDVMAEPDGSRRGLVVLWNSNIMSSKGFFDVAAGVRLARHRGHDVCLEALGVPLGDAERSASEAAAELDRLQANSWFDYVGATSPEEAVRRTAAADVIVLPSRYRSECQPLALIQAMCFGKRIIASDTPALRATLKDYPAVLLAEPTSDAIAGALADALREKLAGSTSVEWTLRKAAERARGRFSIERFDAQMTRLIEGRADRGCAQPL